MNKTPLIILFTVGIVGVGGFLLAKEANAATPSDLLYPLDTAMESIQRVFTFDEIAKVKLEQAILEERQAEVEAVVNKKDSTEDQISEALQIMNQQREKTQVKLETVEQAQVEKGNDQAAESLQKVQEQYSENLQKQLETTTKAQEKYSDVGTEVKKDIETSLQDQNSGDSTQNQNQIQNSNGNGSSGKN